MARTLLKHPCSPCPVSLSVLLFLFVGIVDVSSDCVEVCLSTYVSGGICAEKSGGCACGELSGLLHADRNARQDRTEMGEARD